MTKKKKNKVVNTYAIYIAFQEFLATTVCVCLFHISNHP